MGIGVVLLMGIGVTIMILYKKGKLICCIKNKNNDKINKLNERKLVKPVVKFKRTIANKDGEVNIIQ